MESFASSNGSVGNLTLALLRDPAAVVELFSAFLLAFYMLQIVLKNSSPLSDEISADFFNDEEDREFETSSLGLLRAQPRLKRHLRNQVCSISPQIRSPQVRSPQIRSPQIRSPQDYFPSQHRSVGLQQRELPTRERVQFFNRAVFSELSDRGAIFPSAPCSISREQRLKLYSVGTYVSSKKRSLRKSSAVRMRLPQ